MERIDSHEGQTFWVGGFCFTVAHARGGRVVIFANSGFGETQQDTERKASELRANLDKEGRKDDNTACGVGKSGIPQGS